MQDTTTEEKPAWWQRNEKYTVLNTPRLASYHLWGPKGAALVQVFDEGRTSTGWGAADFMRNYEVGKFSPTNLVNTEPFAYVMRSFRGFVVDIDGKNGGIESARMLGKEILPKTLAETSKSGTGYHLFYRTQNQWDPVHGFAKVPDSINIAQGIDIRGVGCVYHYDTQRWNDLPVLKAPDKLMDMVVRSGHYGTVTTQQIEKQVAEGKPEDIAFLHHLLKQNLEQPIPPGRRNQTLFAIGTKLKAAVVPNWETLIYDKAIDEGLPMAEADKLVKNIQKYG